jgi:hypothetical protein
MTNGIEYPKNSVGSLDNFGFLKLKNKKSYRFMQTIA